MRPFRKFQSKLWTFTVKSTLEWKARFQEEEKKDSESKNSERTEPHKKISNSLCPHSAPRPHCVVMWTSKSWKFLSQSPWQLQQSWSISDLGPVYDLWLSLIDILHLYIYIKCLSISFIFTISWIMLWRAICINFGPTGLPHLVKVWQKLAWLYKPPSLHLRNYHYHMDGMNVF